MGADTEGAARRAQDGIAVSSGDSSAATPQPAVKPEGATLPGVNPGLNPEDATLPAGVPSPVPPKPAASAAPQSGPANDMTLAEPGSSGSGTPNPIFSNIGATIFRQGDVLGGRYEILKLLGMGGMGAVYKARDMEVERTLGLKVIRPDLAGNPAILARFKQELVLARQITHKNIIRIYDLNEADGVKFITMEFIEGEDLRTILTRQGKLAPAEAVDIILQVCAGLQAAHVEGVIHRDLKPSNIMRDPAGRVVIMDFGLARTVQGDGMTQTGMMIGTMEYMSPEQAMGKDLDARSDEFAVGLILYELLTGFIPFQADSAIASLVKRTQERAVPLLQVDATIPPSLSDIVAKCLERDPNDRFASIQGLMEELEIWQGKRSPSGRSMPLPQLAPKTAEPPAKQFPWKWIAAGAMAVVLAVGAFVALRPGRSSEKAAEVTQGPITSLAIIPFYNSTGDPGLNWMGSSMAETLASDMGHSGHLRMVSPDRLQQVLDALHISPSSQLDVSTLKRIAENTGADTVITGQYEKFGDQLRINSTIFDLKNGRNIPIKTDVASDKQLLAGLDSLADEVRQKLATTPDILKELQANSQHVSTTSVPALRAYDEGLKLARSGDSVKAAAKFEEATSEDPKFAMAFSKLAQSYAALGYDDKAEQASRSAVALSDNLSPQDKYLIEANHARITNDSGKAIAAYENLTKVSPDNTDAQFALATLYEGAARYDDARKRLDKVLAADPKYVDALYVRGRVEIRAGNPSAALDYLNRALGLAIQFDNKQEKGNVLNALGLAYRSLGKPEDALRNYQQALEIRKSIGDERGVASTLGNIAGVQSAMGNSNGALASYKEAVEMSRKIGDKNGLALNLMNLGAEYNDHGKFSEGLTVTGDALQIYRDTGNEPYQAICLNNIGTAHFGKGEYQDAITNFQQAYDIRNRLKLTADATESLHNLGETYLKLGQYDAALSNYLKALEARRAAGDTAGAALEASSMGALLAVQGRFSAALSNQQQAVKGLQDIKDRSFQMVTALAEYGQSLAAVGRAEEGQKYIADALKLAGEVNNDSATAEAINCEGDNYFYQGQYPAARQQYEHALQIATKASARDQVLIAKLNLAKTDIAQGHAQAALPALKKLMQDADTGGFKAQAVQAAIYYAQALLATNHAKEAQQVLEGAAGRAEKLGLLVEQARAQYLLGSAISKMGKPKDAVPHYREAVRILESISKEDGAARVLERADLKDIYREASSSYQGGA